MDTFVSFCRYQERRTEETVAITFCRSYIFTKQYYKLFLGSNCCSDFNQFIVIAILSFDILA